MNKDLISNTIKKYAKSIKEFLKDRRGRKIIVIIVLLLMVGATSCVGVYCDWIGRIGLNLAIEIENDAKIKQYIESRIERENLYNSVLKGITCLADGENEKNYEYLIDRFLYFPNEFAKKYQDDVFLILEDKGLFEVTRSAKQEDFLYETKWLKALYEGNRDAYSEYILDALKKDMKKARMKLEEYYKQGTTLADEREKILEAYNEVEQVMTDVNFLIERFFIGARSDALIHMLKKFDEKDVKTLVFSYLSEGFQKKNDIALLKKQLNTYCDVFVGNQEGLEELIEKVNRVILYKKEKRKIEEEINKKENEIDTNKEKRIEGEIADIKSEIDEKQFMIELMENNESKSGWINLSGYIIASHGIDYGWNVYEIALLNAYGYPSSSHALLYTKETTFSSKGRFSMEVEERGTRSVQLNESQGSFTQNWVAYYEVTSEERREHWEHQEEGRAALSRLREERKTLEEQLQEKQIEKNSISEKNTMIQNEILSFEQRKTEIVKLEKSFVEQILEELGVTQ